MSKVKAAELRNLTTEELEQKKDALKKELFDLRQKRVSGQLEKPHFFKQFRRQIAQMSTIQQEIKSAKLQKKATL